MALSKSMLVARVDLKMALKVSYVKYGLVLVVAIGPLMVLGLVGLMAFSMSAIEFTAVMAIMNPMLRTYAWIDCNNSSISNSSKCSCW